VAPAPANNAPQPDKAKPETKSDGSLLGCFRYLSTVSGGGYVGSWLSSWLKRNEFHQVIENLTGRPSGPDVEPPEISWLRAYSNYLTPRVGLGSADTWTGAAIFLRNLILNWLVIVPAGWLLFASGTGLSAYPDCWASAWRIGHERDGQSQDPQGRRRAIARGRHADASTSLSAQGGHGMSATGRPGTST